MDSIDEIEKDIDRLYKIYYTIGYRDRTEQLKILHKIAGLKYKVIKLKEKLND